MPTANEIYQQSKTASNVSFASEWKRTQDQLAKMTAGQRVSALGFSSLEAGEYVMAYDALGQARMRVGHQSDGTVAVVYANGDPPPVPTAPVVSARQLGVFVYWDGTFGASARPGDFARVDVHMSTDAGFTPDGTTIVGDLPQEGGILVGADNVTHYIRIVAVSSSDVASAPTADVAVLPLPASQIAAGAIGAHQLAADIALISRIIVGDPSAARMEIDARDGVVPGLRAYDNLGNQTVGLNASTGDFFAQGTFQTGASGERVYIADQELRFYPSVGDNYGSIRAATYITDTTALGWVTIRSCTNVSGQYGAVSATSNGAFLEYGQNNVSVSSGSAYLKFGSNNVTIAGSIGYMTVGSNSLNLSTSSFTSYAGTGYLEVSSSRINATLTTNTGFICDSGAALVRHPSQVKLQGGSQVIAASTNSGGYPLLQALSNSGFQMAGNNISCYNPASGALVAITASNVATSSARSTKTAIEDLPYDPVAALRRAPVQMWERSIEPKDKHGRRRKHLGPMADDMPEHVQVPLELEGETTLGIDMNGQLALVQAAVHQLADRLDALDGGVAA